MEIIKLEEFRRIKNLKSDEFIVITDSATGDIVHIAFCESVKENDFRTKVLENKEKFGKYFHFPTYQEAKKSVPSISICKKCQNYFRGRK